MIEYGIPPIEGEIPKSPLPESEGDLLDEAKNRVRRLVDRQRDRAAGVVGGVAEALRRTAQDLGTENQAMSHYGDMAAERLDDVARYLRQTDWSDAVGEVRDFARRQPYWFIGGAIAAGFVAGRVLSSSASSPRLRERIRSTAQTLEEAAKREEARHDG